MHLQERCIGKRRGFYHHSFAEDHSNPRGETKRPPIERIDRKCGRDNTENTIPREHDCGDPKIKSLSNPVCKRPKKTPSAACGHRGRFIERTGGCEHPEQQISHSQPGGQGSSPSRRPKFLTVVTAVFTPAALTLVFPAPRPSATELFESRNKFKTAATKQRRIKVE